MTPEELVDLAERVAALDRLDSAMAAALQHQNSGKPD